MKRYIYANECCIFMEEKCYQESSQENLKYRPYNRNTAHVECKNKSDANNNKGSWNHFKIIQTISDQNTGEA